jgi:hypothetical protein
MRVRLYHVLEQVAVKKLPAQTPSGLVQANNELRINAAMKDSTRVVPVLGAAMDWERGEAVLVMEKMKGDLR